MTSPTPTSTLPPLLTVAGLDFEVHRSDARRSIGITVDRDGSLIVNAPNDCDEAELAAFAHEKRLWVYKKLAEKDLLLSTRPTKEFVSGEGFAYLGRSYRLKLVKGPRDGDPVKLERGRFVMLDEIAARGFGGRVMIDWYRTRAQRWLERRIGPWALRMGVLPRTIDVRDLGYRWGSLGKNDSAYFHWATVQLPPSLVDYVIVHELAHVYEPNHGPKFWLRVERALPTFQASKVELARTGSGLWLGDGQRSRPRQEES